MKVELWYDPIFTDTKVYIDGFWQNSRDIYGFLYPVLHYPLQTWLQENGSWKGLDKKLNELSRGENVQFTFHGREDDYFDLNAVLAEKENIDIIFSKWEIEQIYITKLKDALKLLNEINKEKLFEPVSCDITDKGWKNIEEWCFIIKNNNMFIEAQKSEFPCACICDFAISSYNDLSKAEKLTQSLKRSSDSIFLIIEDDIRREEISQYCSLFPNMKFLFLKSMNEDKLKKMYIKYGYPFMLKKMLYSTKEVICSLIPKLQMIEDENNKKLQDLLYNKQQGRKTDERLLCNIKERQRWINNKKELIKTMSEELLSHETMKLGGK